MVKSSTLTQDNIWKILEQVTDPEVPVLTILDLGIVRDVIYSPPSEGLGEVVEVIITPTYTGCPAMDMLSMDIKMKLLEQGYKKIKITSVLSPAWTTDWMSEEGKRKLKEYGIAAPNKKFEIVTDGVECPLCNSTHTKLISEFGSTACKALYQCQDCKEPFDYFKCH
ncbi:MAG: phenylacetate-CoA oxygenase subunit PaaJ [Ferruginibacter sp.]|nr:phenylacetate-CoA oxygenase subunit PaaJ [Ferruginibacter sp.]